MLWCGVVCFSNMLLFSVLLCLDISVFLCVTWCVCVCVCVCAGGGGGGV